MAIHGTDSLPALPQGFLFKEPFQNAPSSGDALIKVNALHCFLNIFCWLHEIVSPRADAGAK